jgi:hypothetical protein
VESDGLGLDLALLDIDLVAAKDNGDVLANADKITCGGISKLLRVGGRLFHKGACE